MGHGKNEDLRIGGRVHERVGISQQHLAPGSSVYRRRRLGERHDVSKRLLDLSKETPVETRALQGLAVRRVVEFGLSLGMEPE
jgi:hypothetical protein